VAARPWQFMPYDEQFMLQSMTNFSIARDRILDGPAVESRPVRLPIFVPPEFRPALTRALSDVAKDPMCDALRTMASFFQGLRSSEAPEAPADVSTPTLPPAECARVERAVAGMIDEWRLTEDPAKRVEAVANLLETELVIGALLAEAGEHASRKGEEYVRQCLLPLHRAAELVKSQNKRKKTKQSLQLDRTEGLWYVVDESPEGTKKEAAGATVVIDAAVAEYGPDMLDNDPARKIFHSTWNGGMKRGE